MSNVKDDNGVAQKPKMSARLTSWPPKTPRRQANVGIQKRPHGELGGGYHAKSACEMQSFAIGESQEVLPGELCQVLAQS
jgi:hypothetical protein